jgi:hypothetical protein
VGPAKGLGVACLFFLDENGAGALGPDATEMASRGERRAGRGDSAVSSKPEGTCQRATTRLTRWGRDARWRLHGGYAAACRRWAPTARWPGMGARSYTGESASRVRAWGRTVSLDPAVEAHWASAIGAQPLTSSLTCRIPCLLISSSRLSASRGAAVEH